MHISNSLSLFPSLKKIYIYFQGLMLKLQITEDYVGLKFVMATCNCRTSKNDIL